MNPVKFRFQKLKNVLYSSYAWRVTKHGNPYIRKLLIHGARSAVLWSKNKTNPRSRWIQQKLNTRGHNKTCVALANKNARIV